MLHVINHSKKLQTNNKRKNSRVINIGTSILKVKKQSLNCSMRIKPHAGENGIFGSEEINEIKPAIDF